jgi:hypothetical protein
MAKSASQHSVSARGSAPILITDAAPSHAHQQAARKRKYLIMMGMRVPFLILAVVFAQTWQLSLMFVLLSVPLPWAAVLIANDRPARKAEHGNRFRRASTELEQREHPMVNG